MSTKLTGYVWDGCAASGMKLSSVAIMARLADFSNDEGVCWPSIETIARQIGAGMSTVRTAIARLEAEGWLTRKARRQGIAAGFKGLLPYTRKTRLACSDSDALIIEGSLALLKKRKPYEHSLIVAHYLYGISKRKIAKARNKDEKLIRIEIQVAEGFIDGCLSMLDVKLEMDDYSESPVA